MPLQTHSLLQVLFIEKGHLLHKLLNYYVKVLLVSGTYDPPNLYHAKVCIIAAILPVLFEGHLHSIAELFCPLFTITIQ